MYVDLGTGVRRSKDVPRITYVLKSALVPDLVKASVGQADVQRVRASSRA